MSESSCLVLVSRCQESDLSLGDLFETYLEGRNVDKHTIFRLSSPSFSYNMVPERMGAHFGLCDEGDERACFSELQVWPLAEAGSARALIVSLIPPG